MRHFQPPIREREKLRLARDRVVRGVGRTWCLVLDGRILAAPGRLTVRSDDLSIATEHDVSRYSGPVSSPDAPAAPVDNESDGLDNLPEGPVSGTDLVVRRRLGGRWYLGLVGAVLILHGGGLLFEWPSTVTILELIYPNRDLPVLESRDMGWAGMFLIAGILLIVWTITRLVGRRPVLRGSEDGLRLAVGGPFRRAITVPWNEVGPVSATTTSDDYGTVEVLLLRLADPGRIGPNPWGARWIDPSTLCLFSQDWDPDAQQVADRLSDAAATGRGVALEEPEPDPPVAVTEAGPAVPEPSEDEGR